MTPPLDYLLSPPPLATVPHAVVRPQPHIVPARRHHRRHPARTRPLPSQRNTGHSLWRCTRHVRSRGCQDRYLHADGAWTYAASRQRQVQSPSGSGRTWPSTPPAAAGDSQRGPRSRGSAVCARCSHSVAAVGLRRNHTTGPQLCRGGKGAADGAPERGVSAPSFDSRGPGVEKGGAATAASNAAGRSQAVA